MPLPATLARIETTMSRLPLIHRSFETEAEANAAMSQDSPPFPTELVDRTGWCWPPFHWRRQPMLGDEVSKALNGDSYPRGKIVKLTKTVATTDTGAVFTKRKGGLWQERGGSFVMTFGHAKHLDPDF